MADPWVQASQVWFNHTYGGLTGFQPLTVDGQSGWQTMYALTRALQYELGISPLSDNFGAGTLSAVTAFGSLTATNPNTAANPSNIVKIAQAGLYCKGYNAGNGQITGQWSAATQLAVSNLRTDLGLTASATLTPKMFKFLLAMDAARLIAGGDSVIRQGQQAMNARYQNRRDFYLVPADGYFLRDTHRALLFSIQYELNMVDGVANGNFGPGTKSGLQQQANLSQGATDTSKFFVHLFQFALRVNGYNVSFDGSYGSGTAGAVNTFQQFAALPVTGTANLQTWASLLVSTGDPDRPGTGADCISEITPARLTTLRNAGYKYFGRYLTNTPDFDPDKCIKPGEMERIFASGGRIFPLFQTGGGQISHFTYKRGEEVGEEAALAAWAYRIPENTIIYFSVDFDALPAQVTQSVIPYFQGVQQRIGRSGRTFRVGVYGPRDVCTKIVNAGLAVSSFVSDMSTGYAGNLGQPLPSTWAFDQIRTQTEGSGAGAVEIDKNIVSGRDTGFATLSAAIGVGNDPTIPSSKLDAFEADWFLECYEHEDSPIQQGQMVANRAGMKSRVAAHDAYITQLAAQHNCYKALIMTPLIWEGMVINPGDLVVADPLVVGYYTRLEQGLQPESFHRKDSSTGICQIFAATAIKAINYAVAWGILTSRTYDANRWQDMWEVWQALYSDEQFSIKMALFTMMMEAGLNGGVTPNDLRTMTPSQVIAACFGYNGDNEEAMKYGRKRMMLYYTIQRWHESFR